MGADGAGRVLCSAEGAGLVCSTTSHTPLLDKALARSVVSFKTDRNHCRALRLKKSVMTGARLHDEEATQGGFRGRWIMLTTTYREGCDASAGDISALLNSARMYVTRATNSRHGYAHMRFRYVWVLELTKRLVPHYHVLVWLPKFMRLPYADKRGWWTHGSTETAPARHPVGYLAKYASKFTPECADALPRGFRTHGVGGLNKESKRQLRWWKAPLEARTVLGACADIRKALGGYVDRITGLYWPSPWRVLVGNNGQITVWRFAA